MFESPLHLDAVIHKTAASERPDASSLSPWIVLPHMTQWPYRVLSGFKTYKGESRRACKSAHPSY